MLGDLQEVVYVGGRGLWRSVPPVREDVDVSIFYSVSFGLLDLVKKRHSEGENDEFLKPIVLSKEGLLRENDTLFFFNFRSDRMRQIFEAFYEKNTPPFKADKVLSGVYLLQMTQYKDSFKTAIVFPQQKMDNVLGEWISKKGLSQFHTAETEKYAHVTFFFNGGVERQFEGEERKMIPSPKVPTYDLAPKMSVREVGEAVVEALQNKEKNYSFVMCNFAPPDMVGHTGVYDATVVACEATDEAIGKVWEHCVKNEYTLVVTSDHGNAEEMLEPNGKPKTAHTTNFVPLIIAPPNGEKLSFNRATAELGDVAPTILDLMGLDVPPEMTGKSVLLK